MASLVSGRLFSKMLLLFIFTFGLKTADAQLTDKLFSSYLQSARITSASSKYVYNVTTYSVCTQHCLQDYAETCSYVNYHLANQICEISNEALQEHTVTYSDESGWNSYHTYANDWWDLVFKGNKHIGSSASNLWLGSDYTASPTGDQLRVDVESSSHFKAQKVERWSLMKVSQVKFAFYTAGQEVLKLVFDGHNSTKTDWFAIGRLLQDPWSDLTTSATHVCFSIDDCGVNRRFLIHYKYDGCDQDSGWLIVDDWPDTGCVEWDDISVWPKFAYSTTSGQLNWSANWQSQVGFADVMAIFLKYE